MDGGIHLEAIAYDSGVGQQPGSIGIAIAGHRSYVEVVVGLLEGVPLLEDRQPGKPSLVDLQHESAKESVAARDREPVLLVMIRAVERMARGGPAVTLQGGCGIDHFVNVTRALQKWDAKVHRRQSQPNCHLRRHTNKGRDSLGPHFGRARQGDPAERRGR